MTYIPVARIEEQAARLWREHQLSPNFDVERLLDHLDLNLLWAELATGLLAEISPYDRRVTVNERMRLNFAAHVGLYRFTIGHEIGHWFLHAEPARSGTDRLFGGDVVLCREEQTRDPVETQANKFAAALLAPADVLRDAVPRSDWSGLPTVRNLAARFGMSVQATTYRLYELGLAHEDLSGQPRSGKWVDPNQGSLFT